MFKQSFPWLLSISSLFVSHAQAENRTQLFQLSDCQTHHEIGNLYTEYYYEAPSLEQFGITAYNDYAVRYAARNDCQLSEVSYLDQQLVCSRNPYPVCELDLGQGNFAYVFKDYQDSTVVRLTKASSTALDIPQALAPFDSSLLRLPDPVFCHQALTKNYYASSNGWSMDFTQWYRYQDLRYVVASGLRKSIENLSAADPSCTYTLEEVEASKMACQTFEASHNKLCTIDSLRGGYFHTLLSPSGQGHIIFVNFD